MPENYTFRPVQPSDAKVLGGILYRSKLALTINRLLFKNWPNEAAQLQNYTSTIEGMDESMADSLSVVDNASGDVIGLLALSRRKQAAAAAPADKPEKTADAGGASQEETAGVFNAEVLEMVMATVEELSVETKIDHYELTYLIIEPAHRNKGLGKELMEYAIAKAKAAGIPLIACTEPQVHDFCLKWNVRVGKHVDMNLAKYAPPYSGFGPFRLTNVFYGV